MLVARRLRFALIIGNDRNFSLKTRNETPCRSLPRVVLLRLLRFLRELATTPRNIHTLTLRLPFLFFFFTDNLDERKFLSLINNRSHSIDAIMAILTIAKIVIRVCSGY